MVSGERVAIWWNPQAGRGQAEELAEQARLVATGRGNAVTVLPCDSVAICRAAADDAVADGVERLIVIGGDGTVHHAVQVAAETALVVGVIPTGTGNDLIGPLGLAIDPAVAIDRALGPAAPIDLLRIGHHYAVTVATLGFSVSVNRRADRLRWPRGRGKYTAATIRELISLRPYPLTVVLDGRRFEVSPNLVAFANTSDFGGGMRIAPTAVPDDGQLELVIVGPAARSALLRVLPRVRTGRHIRNPAVQVHRGARATIEAERSCEIWADGEAVGSTPAEITVVAEALQLAGRRASSLRRDS